MPLHLLEDGERTIRLAVVALVFTAGTARTPLSDVGGAVTVATPPLLVLVVWERYSVKRYSYSNLGMLSRRLGEIFNKEIFNKEIFNKEIFNKEIFIVGVIWACYHVVWETYSINRYS